MLITAFPFLTPPACTAHGSNPRAARSACNPQGGRCIRGQACFGTGQCTVQQQPTSSPVFSCSTGYGCRRPWLMHSTRPKRFCSASTARSANGIVGNFLFTSLNSALQQETAIMRHRSASTTELLAVHLRSCLPAPPLPESLMATCEWTQQLVLWQRLHVCAMSQVDHAERTGWPSSSVCTAPQAPACTPLSPSHPAPAHAKPTYRHALHTLLWTTAIIFLACACILTLLCMQRRLV